MSYLAGRIRSERLKRRLSQEQAALKAGMSLRTYKRFEQSCGGNFENFVNVLRAFDRLRILEAIFVEVSTTPNLIERVKLIREKSLSRD